MAPSDVVNLVLRLPKALHGRLKTAAKRSGRSLNTEIINQLGSNRDREGEVFRMLRTALDDIAKLSDKINRLSGQTPIGEILQRPAAEERIAKLRAEHQAKAAAEPKGQKDE